MYLFFDIYELLIVVLWRRGGEMRGVVVIVGMCEREEGRGEQVMDVR